MKVAVRYYTRSGNTETLARAIEDAVGVKAESVSVPLSEKVDILFLGCSYYAFDVDDAVKSFITENKNNIGKRSWMTTFPLRRICCQLIPPCRRSTSQVTVTPRFIT